MGANNDEARLLQTFRSLVAAGKPGRIEVSVNRNGRLAQVDVITRESRVYNDRTRLFDPTVIIGKIIDDRGVDN